MSRPLRIQEEVPSLILEDNPELLADGVSVRKGPVVLHGSSCPIDPVSTHLPTIASTPALTKPDPEVDGYDVLRAPCFHRCPPPTSTCPRS
jgi:hypothetical protein